MIRSITCRMGTNKKVKLTKMTKLTIHSSVVRTIVFNELGIMGKLYHFSGDKVI